MLRNIMGNEIDEIQQLKAIAAVYIKRGMKREAESTYKAVLAIQEKMSGEYSPDVAQTCYQLSGVYSELGQFEHAEELLERALDIWHKIDRLGMTTPEETIRFTDALMALQQQIERRNKKHYQQ